ncbi:MAG: glycosyltransferase family 2 protein [Sarcina sp.]
MEKKEIVAIIVSFNIGQDIYKCYDAINEQVDSVIIVDNGSQRDTINELRKIENNQKTEIIYLSENKGIATALNYGVKLAKDLGYSWVLTMDNDSIACIDMVNEMIKTYNSFCEKEKLEIVSLAPRYIQEGRYSEIEKEEGISYESLVITSGNLVQISIFNEIGCFKDDYFIDYVDNEFCLRILEAGKKIVQVKSAILEHNLGAVKSKKIFFSSISSTNHSPIRRYYLTRNAMDVYGKYKHLNVRHINNTKRVLFKFALQILLVEDNKLNKIRHMCWGYKDYKNKKFGEFEKGE